MCQTRNVLLSHSLSVAVLLALAAACSRDTPPPPASQPTRKVVLEIDRMAGTPPLQLEQNINGTAVSLKAIYAEAGIDLEVRQDQVDLPRQEDIALADLHAMMTAFRSIEAPADVMRVHALVLTRERSDPETLGIMFDFDAEDADGRPREGFAVFADPHETLPGGLDAELLLTVAHELAHCFNLHHPDWEGQEFRSGATVESYSQADSVRWTLSSHSKAHIRSDPGREVWPGQSNIAFGLITQSHLARHNASPSEAFRVVEPDGFQQRRPAAAVGSALRKAGRRDRSRFVASSAHPVKLQLETPKQSYVVGEPIVLTVALHNTGSTAQSVYPLLDPKYRFLTVEVRAPGDDDFEPFQPVLLADARGVKPQVLGPGASMHEEARVFFGADGWVFRQPGEYLVRADYVLPLENGRSRDDQRLASETLKIVVTEPATTSARRARELILGPQQGLYLVLGGGDHLKKASTSLKQAVQEAPNAPQAAALQLALGTAALNPTIDPKTGVQSEPRVEEAQKRLGTTLDAALPAVAVVKAQTELAEALEQKGQNAEAARVRTETMQKMRRHESAQEYIDEIRRPSPSSKKPGKSPGERKK